MAILLSARSTRKSGAIEVNTMKIRKTASGFTLTELVLAVAILTILLGLATVNVVRYLRTLTQLERDGIAREIFVAAQNHLTMAESQGFLGADDSADSYTENGKTFYYLVSRNSGESEEEADLLGDEDEEEEEEEDAEGTAEPLDMLYEVMLPFASVDETVRSGGSYVIRYQKNPALVLEVFYVAQSGRFTHNNEHNKQGFTDYTTAEVRSLVDGYSGSAKKGDRQRYGTDEAVIGWYGADGGATPDLEKGEYLNPPTITVTNAERLYVTIKNPNVDLEHLGEHPNKFEHARLHLEITGETSKNQCSIELINNVGNAETNKPYIIPDKNENGVFVISGFTVYLDDVTQEKTRFSKVIGQEGGGLLPGEDITIRAVSYNNVDLTNIAASAPVTTNSLYASLDGTTAEIANFRHLENLYPAISNVNVSVTDAKQVNNMNWTNFCDFFGGGISVHANNNVKSKSDCYLPITNDGTITYDGQFHNISNVKIDVAGDAGLFATLGHNSSVTDLELVNFSVNSDNGAAGALAGVLDGSTVSGVLARHETDKSGDDYKIVGKTSVGGLIGEITGEIAGDYAVERSAAAVKVVSTNGDAGGLIGTITSDAVTIRNSYAGGHVTTIEDASGNPIGVEYSKVNCNVIGQSNQSNAGGLIGSSAGTLNVSNCYATTSADGATNAGGLIGSMAGGAIKNCYATGYVKGATADVFVGVPGTATYEGNGYFSYTSVVTETTDLVNVKSIPKWDEDSTAYGAGKSKPYDQFLIDNYTKGPQYPDESLYTFLNIVELNRRTTPGWDSDVTWMTTHYGDWPPLDTLVIND